MIKLGTSDLSKAYVGSSEVSKIYLGSDLVYSKEPEVLPYDAKVEYLKTDGYSYINTEIYPTELNLDIQYRSYDYYLTFGWGYNGNTYNTWIMQGGKTIYWKNYNNRYSIPAITGEWAECKYKMDEGFWKNGTLIKEFTASLGNSAISDFPLYLFTFFDGNINTAPSKTGSYTGQISWCKIYKGNTLVRDYIPVRVGQVGYLYDKVSGNLFGNANSQGSFILGSDIV